MLDLCGAENLAGKTVIDATNPIEESPPVNGVLRFFTGFGLGSALPNAIGLASEYAPERRRALVVMFVGSGS